MEFCEEYPNKPPRVKFLSRMFHPNIYADGGICLDILKNKYDTIGFLFNFEKIMMLPKFNDIFHKENFSQISHS